MNDDDSSTLIDIANNGLYMFEANLKKITLAIEEMDKTLVLILKEIRGDRR